MHPTLIIHTLTYDQSNAALILIHISHTLIKMRFKLIRNIHLKTMHFLDIKPMTSSIRNTSSSFRMVSTHTVFYAGHVTSQSIICLCSQTRSLSLFLLLFLTNSVRRPQVHASLSKTGKTEEPKPV